VILDVSDRERPKHVSTLSVYPPLGSTIAVHSAVPLVGRDVVVINSEALQERGAEPADYVATVDISDESGSNGHGCLSTTTATELLQRA
jgi:hypothetical protein